MDCTRVFVSGPTVLLLPVPGQRRCCRPPTQSHGDRFSPPRRFIVSALRGGGLPFHGMARRLLAPGTGERVRRPTTARLACCFCLLGKGRKGVPHGTSEEGERRRAPMRPPETGLAVHGAHCSDAWLHGGRACRAVAA